MAPWGKLLLAAVAVLLAPAISAGDPTAASPTQGPGTVALKDSCAAAVDCSTAGADCVRRACRCPVDSPVFDAAANRCIKGVAVNDTCEVNAQCHWLHDLTNCVENRCVCLYGLVEKEGTNGMTCAVDAAEATRQLGESCNDEGAVCGLGSECRDSQCRCHSDLPENNKQDMCGKGANLGDFCRFNKQCQANLPNTECRDNRCRCIEGRVAYPYQDGRIRCLERGEKKWGDQCNDTLQCGYENAQCTGAARRVCDCHPDFPATNNLDKCDIPRVINQTCTFNEQCDMAVQMTDCRGGLCACRFGMTPQQTNGVWNCGSAPETPKQETHLDPAMIGVLVGMALMFIILCVVLRLFSKARWRENRTIFNTPNPRLMNVSLLRDSKLLHSGGERRGSRASVRAPSRQPSMASLRPQSPSQSLGSRAGSRRGSRASSNASGTSTKSPKSPTRPEANNTAAPVLENVTVEVQDPKA